MDNNKDNRHNMVNGAIPDKKDDRDYTFEALGTQPLTEDDWKKGYDIRDKGFNIPVKNQNNSYSCVGQAFAYYRGVLEAVLQRRYRDVSAKSIYSLISLGYNQGAYLRDGAKTLKDLGALYENILPSKDKNGVATETWLRDKTWLNEDIKSIMELLKVADYYKITDWSMDGFARAIREGYGAVAGVNGTNNGTWENEEPQPPKTSTPQNQIWGHAIYCGGFGIDSKGKYILILNSWGEGYGKSGWQKLRESWFGNNGAWIFPSWTLIIKNNIMNETAKILKDKNSSAVGVFLPAISEAVLKSYCLNFGKSIPMSGNDIDWAKLIEGEYNIN